MLCKKVSAPDPVGNSITKNNLLTQVDPSLAWLRDDCEDTAYFPQQDGNFNLESQALSPFCTLIVEGPSVIPPPRSSPASSLTLTSTPSSSSTLPNFRSVTASKRIPSFSLKILKATMQRNGSGRRKPVFTTTGQTYIDLVDSTANVEHISGVIKARWGSDYTLVTGDGVPLEDSPATHG